MMTDLMLQAGGVCALLPGQAPGSGEEWLLCCGSDVTWASHRAQWSPGPLQVLSECGEWKLLKTSLMMINTVSSRYFENGCGFAIFINAIIHHQGQHSGVNKRTLLKSYSLQR